jgi:hypothetical protein
LRGLFSLELHLRRVIQRSVVSEHNRLVAAIDG